MSSTYRRVCIFSINCSDRCTLDCIWSHHPFVDSFTKYRRIILHILENTIKSLMLQQKSSQIRLTPALHITHPICHCQPSILSIPLLSFRLAPQRKLPEFLCNINVCDIHRRPLHWSKQSVTQKKYTFQRLKYEILSKIL